MTPSKFVVPADAMLGLKLEVKRLGATPTTEEVMGAEIVASAFLDGPPAAVGAVLRTMADLIDPPKKVTRGAGPTAPDTD